jgi:hypothetical protein
VNGNAVGTRHLGDESRGQRFRLAGFARLPQRCNVIDIDR